MVHNCYREAGVSIVVVEQPNLLPLPLEVSVCFAEPGAHITVQRSGNLEGASIYNLGFYPPNGTRRISLEVLGNFRNYFVNGNIPANGVGELPILRNLFRLECIREPATLITCPMFHELALLNNNAGYSTIIYSTAATPALHTYSFNSIGTMMPMGPDGSVMGARKLRQAISEALLGNQSTIYYRYDYQSVAAGAGKLADLENNLLFHYIMHLSGLTAEIRGILYNANNKLRQLNAQRAQVQNAQGWQQVPGSINNYQKTVDVNGNHIIFLLDDDGNEAAQLTAYDFVILSFPLNIINNLMIRWYGINLELPNQQIECGIRLTKVENF